MDVNNLTQSGLEKAKCPSCSRPLWFKRTDKVVECCCNNEYTPSELLAGSNNGDAAVAAAPVAADLFQLIDNPESGIIYLESRFATYNWAAYCEDAEILIPEIEAMVEKNKIKHGASASAWVLDFESVATPLEKKIEGIGNIANDIAERYSNEDNADVFSTFDKYRELVAAVLDNKDALVARLNSDIEFAAKVGLDAAKVDEMKAKLASVQQKVAALKLVDELYDIPEVEEMQKKVDKQKVAEFAAKGINAEANYDKAMAMLNSANNDRGKIVDLFESVRGYKKSISNINKLNHYFNYYNQFYAFFGKYYTFKSEQKVATVIDPNSKEAKKNKKNNVEQEEEYVGTALSLYEVVDGQPGEVPVVTDITQIITVYGNCLFYVKLNKAICAYNFYDETVTEIDTGKLGDYILYVKQNDPMKFNSVGTCFYIKKKLHAKKIDAKGCFAKLFKKGPEIIERKNNFSIIEVNMAKCEVSTLVEELVDVTEFYNDNLFYCSVDENDKDCKQNFNVVNVNTKESKQILDMNCDIHAVVEKKVIYSIYAPNAYNRDLHSYDIETGKDVLIESNVYEYFNAIKDRVFYTVGNNTYRPLFSNSVEGNERLEIMTKVQNVAAVIAGWMYIIKGSGVNAALIKMSSDGKRRIVVCTQFKQSVKINDNYVYYIDTANALRVVRSDGMNNTVIANNIDPNSVIIDKNCIYYTRYEQVSNYKKNSSLYKMELDGHNIRKLVFNINNFKNYDEDTIIISRKESALFEFTIPAAKAKEEPTIERKTFNLTRYFTYNKNTEELNTILTIGLPHSDKYNVKVGCFGKTEERESTFKEIPPEPEKIRRDIAEAGEVSSDDVANMPEPEQNGILGKVSGALDGLLSKFKK